MPLVTQFGPDVIMGPDGLRPVAAEMPDMGTFFKPAGIPRLDIVEEVDGDKTWTTVAIDPGWVVVTNFGAKGDDNPASATENVTAIRAAIDSMPATGGTLYFPPGTYYIDDAIDLISQLHVLGASVQGTTIRQINTAADIFRLTDCIYVTIEQILLRGPGSGTGIGINFIESAVTCNYISVRNVAVFLMGSHGIKADHIVVSTFDTVVVNTCLGNGFYIVRGTSSTFLTCYAVNCNQAGFNLHSMSYGALIVCASDLNGLGYLIDTCLCVTLTSIGIESCRNLDATYDGTGLKITGSTGVIVNGAYNNVNPTRGFWVTGNSQLVTLNQLREITPAGTAVNSIRTDAGTIVSINSERVTTATNYSTRTVNFPSTFLGVVKATDQTKTSDAALGNDSNLSLFTFANGKYILEGEIVYSSATAADIRMAFSGPAGATLLWTIDGLDVGAAGTAGSIQRSATAIADAGVQVAGGAGAGTNVTAKIEGLLTMGSTAGSIVFRWAQGTSDASNTVVRAGSWINVRRIE